MAYVVTDNCVDCRFTDCVEVCPVDCFYLDNEKNMVLIHGDECIDCGACEPACPVEAIYAGDDLPADKRHWEKTATQRIKVAGLKLITEGMDPLPTAAAKKANLGL